MCVWATSLGFTHPSPSFLLPHCTQIEACLIKFQNPKIIGFNKKMQCIFFSPEKRHLNTFGWKEIGQIGVGRGPPSFRKRGQGGVEKCISNLIKCLKNLKRPFNDTVNQPNDRNSPKDEKKVIQSVNCNETYFERGKIYSLFKQNSDPNAIL